MDDRDHIIRLGKCLASEARAGYINAPAGGLSAFLARWRSEANGASRHPVVEDVLRQLEGYETLDRGERQARIDHSLDELRALFRTPTKPPLPPTPPLKGERKQSTLPPAAKTEALRARVGCVPCRGSSLATL